MTQLGKAGVPTRFRLARPADAAAIATIYEPVVRRTASSFKDEPPDAAEIARRIVGSHEQLPWLVAVEAASGKTPGYALATSHRSRAAYRWSVEVSVYVDESARGRGIARSLYRRLHDLLREQRYRITYAVITLPNPASTGLHEALEYRPIGVFPRAGFKLGRWHDVLWMRREIAPLVDDPAEPIPLAELDQGKIEAILA